MPRILQNHYVLAVHDIKKAAGFFVDNLGFQVTAEPRVGSLLRKITA